MTCAICLERTPLVEIALVKGCEHQYCGEHRAPQSTAWLGTKHGLTSASAAGPSPAPCSTPSPDRGAGCCVVLPCAVNCILQWSLCKEWCPQCKHPFDYLLTHKQLDGTVTDFLTEESVVLLKRARWFEEYMRVRTPPTTHQHHRLKTARPYVCSVPAAQWLPAAQSLPVPGVIEQQLLGMWHKPHAADRLAVPILKPAVSSCLRSTLSHVSAHHRPRKRARPPSR